MNPTKIEWCDFTVNPIKGLCPMDCKDNQGKPYCYARRMYKRFGWNPQIRFDQTVFFSIDNIPAGSRVFVGSTMELFGDWVQKEWRETILRICRQRDDITWIFLTKQPQKLIKWSPFLPNCWVGVSVTNTAQFVQAHKYLLPPLKATVRFISFEPLLNPIAYPVTSPSRPRGYPLHIPLSECCDWVILGQQTPIIKKTAPHIEWVKEIVESADKAGLPVFLKNNLKPLIYNDELPNDYADILLNSGDGSLRQEFPKCTSMNSTKN